MSATASDRGGWTQRYLDPAERLAEILFGLIMVLTITLTAGLTVGYEPGAAREMLIAAIGCNIAWGLIDGGMYIMGALMERGRRASVAAALRQAPDEAAAVAVLDRALADSPVSHAPAGARRRFYGELWPMLRRIEPRVRITRDDVMGALASGWLVIAATIPAAVPFLVMDNARLALRVSNALLLALLFFVGFSWGRYALVNRWIAGTVFLVVGVILVGVAIALGG